MYIQSIEYKKLLDKYEIIELKVRGKKNVLETFMSNIQDVFDLAHNEWTESLSMLTLTFDKKPKIQTINMVRSYTKEYIKSQHGVVSITPPIL